MNTMKPILLIIIFLLLSMFTMAQQPIDQKLSPWVRQVLKKEQVAQQQTKARGVQQRPSPLITAFVQTFNDDADQLLSDCGCRTFAHLGDISIAAIPLNQLQRLVEHPYIGRIEANPSAQTLMDTVPIIIDALSCYKTTDMHLPFTGKDVVVGVMDIGFDLTHPNFYKDVLLRSYRIGAVWDQLSKDTVGSSLPVGRDFIGGKAVRAHQHSIDGLTQTHGTHTLGIAAGSGYDTNYRGIAYESDICLVSNAVSSDIAYIDSADYYKYTTATDALGFKYIFDYADKRQKPCVISFSEGYHPYLDEPDSLYSAFLEKLSTPGHIIVSAAGNENLRPTYIDKPTGQKEAGAFIRMPYKAGVYRIKADGPMALHLYVYGNGSIPTDTITFRSESIVPDSLLADTFCFNDDTCAVYCERYASKLDSDTLYALTLIADKSISVLPLIALVAEGSESHVEVFGSSSYAFTQNDVAPQWCHATYGHNIMAPSCFAPVICVGSTSHRLGFTNYLGQYRDFSNGRVKGMRTPASSIGPAMTGLIKPDVMAPGDNIVSSYSSFYLENNPDASDIKSDVAHFEYNGRTYAWNSNAGTSMSCPAVAGTIALWLQACPTLTYQDVIDIISRTSREPDPSLSYPNNEYGYGEINAYKGLLDILGVSKIKGISQEQPQQVCVRMHDKHLQLLFNEPSRAAVRLRIFSLTGSLLYQINIAAEVSEYITPLPTLSAGIYVVQLQSKASTLTGSQLIRIDP